MAHQLAALPKKQFEMYRSKKILSNDHSFIWPSGSQVIKDKLDTSFISRSFISNVEKDLNVLQNHVEILDSVDQASNDAQPKTAANKKKRSKSKKGKPANSVADETGKPADINSVSNGTGEPSINAIENGTGILGSSSVANGTGIQGNGIVDAKYKVKRLGLEGCVPLCVSMNTNLVADISIRRETETGQDSTSTKADLSCGSTSSNDSGVVTPKELFLSEDIKEVDSGLGSYASPVFAKEPPFGFPPSSQKLLESALGLLPSVTFDKDSSSNLVKTSQPSENFIQQSEDSKGDFVLEKQTHDIEDDPISDVSDTKEVSKDFVVIEGDSVDGDVSSSSAVEDEGGWQSQTKRSHRRKKKELLARANREKNHNDRFQRKDFHKPQSDNQFRKNHHHRKSVDEKKNYSKTTEKVLQDKENKNSNAVVDSSAVNSTLGGQTEAKNKNESGLKAEKGLELPSRAKNDFQKEMLPTQKVLSYRDALLKARSKAEPAESSDSGVDANSVSSCELSSRQSETQKDSFNKLQCVDYLRNAWKKVMSDAKQGLVINFSVDSDPVLCEQKRKKLASRKHGAPSELKLKNF